MNALWMPVRQVADVVYPSRPTLLRWGLHLAFWSVLLVILWQVNRFGEMDRLLRSPWPILHRVWLPLLAVMLYPLGWLGVGLWNALRQEASAGARPEIESAWNETVQALEQAGINPHTTPAYLILGPHAPELHKLLGAALPGRAAAPFQVFAQRNAIFFACAPHAGDAEQTTLQHLCRLLLRERAPRHPVQGIVVALPFAAEQSPRAFDDRMKACREELCAVRQATGLELPIYFAVSGLAPPVGDASAWLQRFPPAPDLDPAEIASMYRLGLDWLFLERIPQQVRPLLKCDPASLTDNIRIYQWLSAVQAWRGRLDQMLTEATQTEDAEPGLVAGCYLAAAEQADALQADLHSHRHAACWTAQTTTQHTAQRRRVWLGYSLGIVGMAALVLSAAGVWAWR